MARPSANSAALWGIAVIAVLYWVDQRLWPAPSGIVVNGMVLGGLTALIAFGIALVYRANRIISFAQGDIGAAPAVLAVLLIVGPGWPYFVAMPIGILAGAALGALVELSGRNANHARRSASDNARADVTASSPSMRSFRGATPECRAASRTSAREEVWLCQCDAADGAELGVEASPQ